MQKQLTLRGVVRPIGSRLFESEVSKNQLRFLLEQGVIVSPEKLVLRSFHPRAIAH